MSSENGTSNTETAREVVAREIYSYIGDGEEADEMAGVVLAALERTGWQITRTAGATGGSHG